MIELTLYFLAIPVSTFILLWLFRVRAKKYLIGIPLFILFSPVLFGTGIYLLRTPIQQGVFLAEIGPILSGVFPAEDLYYPLAEEPINPEKSTYIFNVTHKYVGSHAIFIEVPSGRQKSWDYEKSFKLKTEITEGTKILFTDNADQGLPYRYSNNKYGYRYISYEVPENVPVAKLVTVTIKIENDIKSFLERHKGAKIVVRKKWDL